MTNKRVKKTPCEKCPLYEQKQAGHFLAGRGDLQSSQLMVIQEVPSKKQIEQGGWSTGRSGLLLLRLLAVGDYFKLYVTSAVKCRPEDGVIPSRAILLCREAHLDQELAAFQGEKVVALGVTSAHALHRRNRRLRELIGHPETELVPGKKVLSVWSPSAFFAGATKGMKQIMLDIKKVLVWGLRPDTRVPGPREVLD